ncbi:MAG: hypothetical protein RMX65_018595 [Nostoc sp. DedQUE01]
MDIQSTLSFFIQAIFMSFVTLIIFQFITGLFVQFDKAQAVATFHTAAATPSFQPAISTTVPKNFDLLPDPWLNNEIQPSQQQQTVVLEFPTVKLLPPAAQVQPKARATKKSTKTTTAKRTTKPTNKAATQKNSKPRKSAAA